MNSGSVCWFSKVWPSGRVVFRCGVSLWYYVVRVVDAVNSPDTWWTSWCALRSMSSGSVCWFSKVWPSGRVVFRCGVSLWYYVVRVVDAVNSPDTWWTSWCALRSMSSGSVCWFSQVWPSGRVVFRCGVSLWYYVVRVVDAVNSPDTWWTSWCALRSMSSGSVCWFSKVWPSGRVVFDVGLVCDIMLSGLSMQWIHQTHGEHHDVHFDQWAVVEYVDLVKCGPVVE